MPVKLHDERLTSGDEITIKALFNKHLLMGYLFLGLVFAGAISAVYYWDEKNSANAAQNQLKQVGSGEKTPQQGMICIQVITKARHKITGEVRDFPTPCHVTEDWEIIK